MEIKQIIESLHPIEIKILNAVDFNSEFNVDTILNSTDLNEGQIRRGLDWLISKKIIKQTSSIKLNKYKLTEKGKDYLSKPLIENEIIKLLTSSGEISISDIMKNLDYDKKDIGSVIGNMKSSNQLVQTEAGKVRLGKIREQEYYSFIENLFKMFREQDSISEESFNEKEKSYLNELLQNSFYKNLIKQKVTEIVNYTLTDSGIELKKALSLAGVEGDEISQITIEILKERSWVGKRFRKYNLNIPAPHIIAGIKHPYREFLDFLKNKFISLGFEQMWGEIVETEFWNMDALYMPQTHPARDIHDVYFVKYPQHAKEIEQEFFKRVAETHKNGGRTNSKGWGYEFDETKAKQLILRSQGTVLSARMLASNPKIPGKYFAIARCFRYDKVDATHLADFFQVEGIVLSENANFKTLLGLLALFAKEIAMAEEFKFAPAYFPFTEPSVEIHIKHPKLGWYELGGAGIFRPEVTIPLGINVPVLAWGLGVDRMAMMALNINDIRELFSRDLQFIRNAKMELKYA